ncbi:MAG TPA: ATP-binding protein [Acetobacteraceae bacterium]|nr:ATP-binding protein [Acetobacteraceae bacterium]
MPETLIVQAEMAELPRIRAWADALSERLHIAHSVAFSIQLCLEEAFSNIVLYGFSDVEDSLDSNRDVHLVFEHDEETATITIEDHGMPFDPLRRSEPAKPTSLDNAPIGGFGIHLMRHFARAMTYERRDELNHLTICFDLGASPTSA